MKNPPDFSHEDVYVGMRCMAPVKRPTKRSRTLEPVEVTWVSHDSRVVEAITRRKGAKVCAPYAACLLRP